MSINTIIYQVATVLLALMFTASGIAKLLPQLAADFDAEFRRYVRIPPFNMINPDPVIYRTAVALTEVVCAILLAVGKPFLQKIANLVLLAIMIGALYTHFMVNDSPDRWGGAIVGFVLCLVRLYCIGSVKVKIN